MPEHPIRFRGGWEACPIEGKPVAVRRLTLPMAWPPGFAGPVRLTRRFGRPPIDPEVESARLELRAVPGLRSLGLNGVDLGAIPPGVLDWTVEIDGLLEARNTLILVVDLPAEAVGGWGSIALVIGSKGEAGE